MSQHGVPERLSNMSKGFQEDGAGGSTMELLVETLTGTAFEMTVSPSDTILAIKSKIFRVEGIPISQQHLLYNLRELEDSCSLRSLKIGGGARLRLVLGMRGGPVSTRRLPPPAHSNHREDGDWGSAGSGCKVVLVFREGDKLNVLRVRDDQRVYSSSLPQLAPTETESTVGALRDNAVTMNKMLELRRRMRSRRTDHGDKVEIQKTRSEEILSVPSLLDDSSDSYKAYMHYNEAEDTFAPLYDGNYTRYDYDCTFSDRYTLLPPIGTRADSIQSVQDADLKLSDSLAGSILVKGRDDEAAILEEIDSEAIDECHLRQDSPQLSAQNLTPISAAEYESSAGCSDWWVSGARSPLAAAILSASTSRLDRLPRGRILPALSRHRNREHLHLSDEGLDLAPRPRNLEVGSERRQRRIENIAHINMAEPTSLFNFHDLSEELNKGDVTPTVTTEKEKKIRIRCGFCKKKLTIATVHKCRCGAEFCAPHRYAEVHGCAYDYKANAHQYLQRANPLISAPKLPKI